MKLYYFKTEISLSEISKVYTSHDLALEAAKKEWEDAMEEYDENLTWITEIDLLEDPSAEKKFTVKEFQTYLETKDSLGDIHYYLNEDNIISANEVEGFEEDE